MRPSEKEDSEAPIDFSQNLNPFVSPINILLFIKDDLEALNTYPEPYGKKVRQASANFFNIPYDAVAAGVGSTQILFNIPQLISYERAIIPAPTFWEYQVLNERAGKEIHAVPLREENNFDIDFEELEQIVQAGDAVFLCNINNPTSRVVDHTALLEFIKNHPEIYFIVDETYLLFAESFDKESLTHHTGEYANLIVIISISKFFSIPGVRIGIMIASKELIKKYYDMVYIPFSLGSVSEKVIPRLFKELSYIKRSRKFITEERNRVVQKVENKLGSRVHMVSPHGNFILMKVQTGQTDKQIASMLLERDIIIRIGSEISLSESWLRFCIHTKKNNDYLLKILDEILINENEDGAIK